MKSVSRNSIGATIPTTRAPSPLQSGFLRSSRRTKRASDFKLAKNPHFTQNPQVLIQPKQVCKLIKTVSATYPFVRFRFSPNEPDHCWMLLPVIKHYCAVCPKPKSRDVEGRVGRDFAECCP